MRSNGRRDHVGSLTRQPLSQEGANNLKFLVTQWRQHEDTPLSRLQTPLDIFLDTKLGVVSLDGVGAPAAQAAAAPSSPPLRR
jgi:hypothetical protein